MSYDVKIIKDSISQFGDRLTTLEVTFPRIVLSEFNTHRMLSRNSASSRAIPIDKIIKKVEENPFIPSHWGKNQKGMQAHCEIDTNLFPSAVDNWLAARDEAVKSARVLQTLGVHKQIVNRLLEPFMWHTVIVTATDWDNFFALRCHTDAQPEIKFAAEIMKSAMSNSNPHTCSADAWHMPLTHDIDVLLRENHTPEDLKLISAGRCARVSYLTHNGSREPSTDIELAKKLLLSGHMSPFEHVARPMTYIERSSKGYSGNLKGWIQFRKLLPNENRIL